MVARDRSAASSGERVPEEIGLIGDSLLALGYGMVGALRG